MNLKGLLFTHINNEMYTKSMKQKAHNVKMGVTAGVPDYLVLIEQNLCRLGRDVLIFIEMKRSKKSTTSPAQKVWLEKLGKVKDVEAVICKGFDEARKYLDQFLYA